ncbi:MAG: cation diffusion facilitator family transporter [Rhizomicrobium sp.]|nr:cation diffusion facilitator family transporter [Rhizomicrobium sp.]
MTDNHPHNGRMMRRVAVAAVIVATALAGLKTVAFILTDSMAMLGSLADSALDIFASFLNLLAVNQALTPADREHRFGHGKAEPLAGLAQGALIGGSALFLAFESIQRLLVPHPISNGGIGLVVMAVSIALTLVLVAAQRYVVRRTGSIAIQSDSAHYISDILVNAGVIIGIVGASVLGWSAADPLVALAIAGVIAHTAWEVFRQSYDQLMDHELPEADRDSIRDILLAHADIHGIHDLRTRAAGMQSFIQVHIELDPELSLRRAHEISDEVEAQIRAAYPQAEIIVHQDLKGYEKPALLAQS